MLTATVVALIVLGVGVLVGWLIRAGQVHRERTGRAVAEARLADVEASRGEMTNTFAALAQRAFKDVGEALVQMNKTQIDGSLDTKKAEIEGLLTPVRTMLDQYRGELLKSEKGSGEVYGGLQEQIRSLLTPQEAAQPEAARLAKAPQSPA